MNWRTRASIPVPLACKASALPCELFPLISDLAISLVRYLQFEFNYKNKSFEFLHSIFSTGRKTFILLGKSW